MKFYSTNNANVHVSFEEAVRQGLAPDGGLFMPDNLSPLPDAFWKNFSQKNFKEISFEVASHFLQGELADDDLHKIIDHTLTFDVPLTSVGENIFSLELFHGPTLAFKDFGARFLAATVGHFAKKSQQEITIIVATSGDTGSAVAQGFFNLPGTKVVVLYPSGKVTESQEKQFTTLGGNVTALEVDGTFDDCQRLVKQSFGDDEIRRKRILTSANSINIARLLPQMFYYFRAFQQLPRNNNHPLVISVPSGNFGNLTAGLMAKRMGLPVDKFVVATNVNDVVPTYLQTGQFKPRPSQATISNAMDVGNPSNFDRMLNLYDHNQKALLKDIVGYAFTDGETIHAMQDVFSRYGYILDPHGAVGYLGLKKYLESNHSFIGIFLETAHPGKFKESVEKAIGSPIKLPERLLDFMKKEKKSIRIENDFDKLKKFLLQE